MVSSQPKSLKKSDYPVDIKKEKHRQIVSGYFIARAQK